MREKSSGTTLCLRIRKGWRFVRRVAYGLRIAWVSVASLVAGTVLFSSVPQVQDLFLEVNGRASTNLAYWFAFHCCVIFFWVIPVYVSSRWILSQLDEVAPATDPDIKPVKQWVASFVPPLTAVACFGAVLLGEIASLSNSPTLYEGNSIGRVAQMEVLQGTAAIAIHDSAVKAAKRCAEGNSFLCVFAKITYYGEAATAYGAFLGPMLPLVFGTERVILIIYSMLAGIVVFLWLRRWLVLGAARLGIPTKLTRAVIALVVVSAALFLLFVSINFAAVEWAVDISLGHMMILPIVTGSTLYVSWRWLKPHSGLQASRPDKPLISVSRAAGNERSLNHHRIQRLFFVVFVSSMLMFSLPFFVHPADIANVISRALLLPWLLGILVAPLTFVSYWSIRSKAPLVLALVVIVSATAALVDDRNDIRTVALDPSAHPLLRETIQQAIGRWAASNGCNVDIEANARICPSPFIVAAAGGASRSAFQVAGVLGTIMDERQLTVSSSIVDRSVSASADGTRLVIGASGAGHVWDVAKHSEITVLQRSGENVTISPNGLFALGLWRGEVQVWSIASGNEAMTLKLQGSQITFGTYSPDGTIIVTTSDEGDVVLWDSSTGNINKTLHVADKTIRSALLAADGHTAVTVGASIRIWDVAANSERKMLPGSGTIDSASLSPDGKKLLIVGEAGTTIRDVVTGAVTASLPDGGFAVFSRDGKRIVTRGLQGIRVLNAANGNEIRSIKDHFHDIITADGRYLISEEYDRSLQLWDLEQDKGGEDLKYTQSWELAPFEQQLFAISGVSGGSVGASIAYAAMSDSQDAGNRRPPCRDTSDESDWFAPYTKSDKQGWRASESWRSCLQLIIAGDYISSVALALGTTDFLHFLGLGSSIRGDRAAILEQAFEKRYESVTGHSTFQQPLVALRQRAIERGRWLPMLMLNGTSVITGRRIVASDVDTLQRSWPGHLTGYEATERTIQDAYDLHELLGQWRVKERASEPRRESDSDLPVKVTPEPFVKPDLAPLTEDLRLSTAAIASARFPIISPHGNIRDARTGAIVDRIVDGGYFENFGVLTATELARELKKHWLKPVIILINNDPDTPFLTCAPYSKLPLPKPPEKSLVGLFNSPLQTVIATRQGRGTLAAAAACKELDDSSQFIFASLKPDFFNPKKDLSMSWWLSKFVQKHMDDQLETGENWDAFRQIEKYRKILGPTEASAP